LCSFTLRKGYCHERFVEKKREGNRPWSSKGEYYSESTTARGIRAFRRQKKKTYGEGGGLRLKISHEERKGRPEIGHDVHLKKKKKKGGKRLSQRKSFRYQRKKRGNENMLFPSIRVHGFFGKKG